MARRLFVQIYVAFVAIGLLSLVAAGLSARALSEDTPTVPAHVRVAAQMLLETLPDPVSAPAAFRREFVAHADQLGLHVSYWTPTGRLLARVGDPLPAPPAGCARAWVRSSQGNPGLCFQLPEGNWLAAATDRPGRSHWLVRFGGVLLAIAGTIALGSYPLARRITRRLERLRAGVEAFGAGSLERRVEVEGQDEVADLAHAFNASADRITALVEGQQRVLAHASHELRSPLARLRMALALLEDADGPDRARAVSRAEREIDELDALIEDVLLASRLRGGVSVPRGTEPVDLGALAHEIAQRHGISVTVEAPGALTQGDPRLLARVVANLLDNAHRYGAPPVAMRVGTAADRVFLTVEDRGPGVPEAQRDRIFEPFYQPPGHAESDGGVGLGLSLVSEIARHHGGSVDYAPRDGGGSAFTLTLPRATG